MSGSHWGSNYAENVHRAPYNSYQVSGHPYQPPPPPPPTAATLPPLPVYRHGAPLDSSNSSWNSGQPMTQTHGAYPYQGGVDWNHRPSSVPLFARKLPPAYSIQQQPTVATDPRGHDRRSPIPPPPPPAHLSSLEQAQALQVQGQSQQHLNAHPPVAPAAASKQIGTKEPKPNLYRTDSSMDMSVDEEDTKPAARPQSNESMISRFQARFRSHQRKYGRAQTSTIGKLKTLGMIAYCYDCKLWPDNQNWIQEVIRSSNRKVFQDENSAAFRVVEQLLLNNELITKEDNRYKWAHTSQNISTVIAKIANESIDLDSILQSPLRPSRVQRQETAAGGRDGESMKKKALELMASFRENNKWPRNFLELEKHLRALYTFLPSGLNAKKKKGRVENFLVRELKFLKLIGSHSSTRECKWIHDQIDRELRIVGMLTETSNQTSVTAKTINLSEKALHAQVIDLFLGWRKTSNWPLVVSNLDELLTDSAIMKFAQDKTVQLVRKEIIQLIFVPKDYVAWSNPTAGDQSSAVIPWQMDAIDQGFQRHEHPTFESFTASTTFSDADKKVLHSFCSCYDAHWPEGFKALTRLVHTHLNGLSEREVLSTLLLPNGYVSIQEGGHLSWHFSRIHLAAGLSLRESNPFEENQKLLELGASKKAMAAAQACHNIFCAMDYWPENRAKMIDFVELKSDKAILDFLNIPPHYEVPEKVRNVLELLFQSAELLRVDERNNFAYTWSNNTKENTETAITADRQHSPSANMDSRLSGDNRPLLQSTTLGDPPAISPGATLDLGTSTGTQRTQCTTLDAGSTMAVSTAEQVESQMVKLEPKHHELKAKRKLAQAKLDLANAQKKRKWKQIQMSEKIRVLRKAKQHQRQRTLYRDMGIPPLSCILKKAVIFRIRNITPDDRLYFIEDIERDELANIEEHHESDDGGTSATAVSESPEETKADMIERLKRLLKEQQLKLKEENEIIDGNATKLAQLDQSIKEVKTQIKAHDHHIAEKEKDIEGMQEFLLEKLSELTEKRKRLS